MINYFNRAILFACLFFVTFSSAFSQSVSNAIISPPETNISTPTTFTITAKVDAGIANALVKDSVLLYETNVDGKLLALVGKMYNDGTHGDATANDGIYSSQMVINEPNPLTRFYKVSAAYSGVRNRYLSETIAMNVYPPLSDEIMDQAALAVETIQNNFYLNVASLGIAAAQSQALAEALAHPNIGSSNATLSGDDLSILYVYIDPTTNFKNELVGHVSLIDPAVPSKGAGLSQPVSIPVDAKFPGNDKLLIYSPFHSYGLGRGARYAQSKFESRHYMTFNPNPPEIMANENASLDVIKGLGNYGTVIIDSHGGIVKVNGVEQVLFTSGTPNSVKTPQIRDDLNAKRIGYKGGKHYFILPSFIKLYVGTMKDTFFYLGFCKSLKGDTMWNELKGKGAKVGFGWDESVTVRFDVETITALMDQMLPTSGTTNPPNAKQAFDAIKTKTDPYDTEPAKFVMRTEPSEWGKFEFVHNMNPITLTVSGTVSGYTLPAVITLDNLYLVSQEKFEIFGTQGNTCGTGERGLLPPILNGPGGTFSRQVDTFADFFGAPTVLGVPSLNSGPLGNFKPCSSFFANIRDSFNRGKVWINATSRARQFGGVVPLDWEYQVRYYSGDPAVGYSDRSCTLGVVANAGFYVGHVVTCSLTCDNNLFGKLPANTPACF